MEPIFELINTHILYAPFIVFAFLVISGFGLPISEDLLVITSGVLASQYPDMALSLYLGVFFGVYGGDNVTYWLSRLSGNKILSGKLLQNPSRKQTFEKIQRLFAKRGAIIIIFGRFIPFGVRMLIFIVAGISKYDYKKFIAVDALAVAMTTGLSFFAALYFGNSIISVIDQIKSYLGIILIVVLCFVVMRKLLTKKA